MDRARGTEVPSSAAKRTTTTTAKGIFIRSRKATFLASVLILVADKSSNQYLRRGVRESRSQGGIPFEFIVLLNEALVNRLYEANHHVSDERHWQRNGGEDVAD